MIDVPSRQIGSALPETEWDRAWSNAWLRAEDEAQRGAIPPKTVTMVERQPWGAIGWEQQTATGEVAPGWIVVADPDHPVKLAHRAAAAKIQPHIDLGVSGRTVLGGKGIPLRTAGTIGIGAVMTLAGYNLGQSVDVVPGAWEAITLAIAGGGGSVGGITMLSRRRAQHTKTLTDEQAGPGVLEAVTRVGTVLASSAGDASSQRTNLGRFRADLWEHGDALAEVLTGECHRLGIPPPRELARERSTSHQRRQTAMSGLARAEETEATRLDRVWAEAIARYDGVRDEWADHQTDIDKVLDLPTLADVTEPATAKFITRLGEAADLVADTRPASPATVERFAAATRAADTAWRQAKTQASRVFRSRFNAEERARIRKVQQLMRQALDTGATPQERQSFYRRATALLDQLDHPIPVPELATVAIETRLRAELNA